MSLSLALARSIGWMITLANVAAEPPQTNGSAIVAIPLFFSGIVLFLTWSIDATDLGGVRVDNRMRYHDITPPIMCSKCGWQ